MTGTNISFHNNLYFIRAFDGCCVYILYVGSKSLFVKFLVANRMHRALFATGARRDNGRWRWLDGTILASLVLDSTGFWFESQRGHLFFGISPRGEISQEGFAQGLVSPPATSEDNFRGSACVSEWMLSVKIRWVGLS
jgi:hypothetical protein